MANLKVTPQELRNVSSRMSTARGSMENILNTMGNDISNMQNEIWDSASGRAFNDQFYTVRNNCTGALTAIATHLKNLEEAAGIFEDMEAEQLSRVSSLDSSKIFT